MLLAGSSLRQLKWLALFQLSSSADAALNCHKVCAPCVDGMPGCRDCEVMRHELLGPAAVEHLQLWSFAVYSSHNHDGKPLPDNRST